MTAACQCDGVNCRLGPNDERHGSANGYANLKCRCRECRDAWSEYYRTGPLGRSVREYRERRVAAGLTMDGAERKRPYRPRRTRGQKRGPA